VIANTGQDLGCATSGRDEVLGACASGQARSASASACGRRACECRKRWHPCHLGKFVDWDARPLSRPAPLAGDLRGCATAGTSQVQQARRRVSSFLPSASRYISGTTSRDHELCPAFWPPPASVAVHFRLSGLDLYRLMLAPCLLGCAGTGRQGPALTSLCLEGLRYRSARHSIPVTQGF
jgi:hypothetical protein